MLPRAVKWFYSWAPPRPAPNRGSHSFHPVTPPFSEIQERGSDVRWRPPASGSVQTVLFRTWGTYDTGRAFSTPEKGRPGPHGPRTRAARHRHRLGRSGAVSTCTTRTQLGGREGNRNRRTKHRSKITKLIASLSFPRFTIFPLQSWSGPLTLPLGHKVGGSWAQDTMSTAGHSGRGSFSVNP